MKAADLYRHCNGVRLRQLSDLILKNVPVIDAGVDAVPFKRFRSSVVRFRADRPFMIAVMGFDWEGNPRLEW